jgi:aryl-alcohol dehydrogenase-like predicted oxidoreductase
MDNNSAIPLRRFGKTDVRISALGLGGHHLGAAKDEQTAIEIVHRAVDGGITFYDCCWEYNRGKSEDWLAQRPPQQDISHDQGLHSRPRCLARHADA